MASAGEREEPAKNRRPLPIKGSLGTHRFRAGHASKRKTQQNVRRRADNFLLEQKEKVSKQDDFKPTSVVPTEAPKARSGGTLFRRSGANRRKKVPPLRLASLGFGRDDR
jgi:hypothetical protein